MLQGGRGKSIGTYIHVFADAGHHRAVTVINARGSTFTGIWNPSGIRVFHPLPGVHCRCLNSRGLGLFNMEEWPTETNNINKPNRRSVASSPRALRRN